MSKVGKVDFPTFTICGQGMNDNNLMAGFVKEFFKFLESEKNISVDMTPLTAISLLFSKVR